jgi:hypothetical protein
MRDLVPSADLERALELSRAVAAAADRGEFAALADLDAARLELLQAFRARHARIDARERVLLSEIASLNERAIGYLEHHRRIKGRAMDLVALGQRAVAAYACNRQRR